MWSFHGLMQIAASVRTDATESGKKTALRLIISSARTLSMKRFTIDDVPENIVDMVANLFNEDIETEKTTK